MSIATDLQTIAENVPQVYAAGKQKQYDDFWDNYQYYGTRTDYNYAFGGAGWTDSLFNPKYPINAKTMATCFCYSNITTITTPIYVDAAAAGNGYVFYASKIKTINSITVSEKVTYNTWFNYCSALENITFYGTIGNSIDIHWSTKLSIISAKSILSHLSTNGTGKTVTFATEIQSALEADDEAIGLIGTAISNGWSVIFA